MAELITLDRPTTASETKASETKAGQGLLLWSDHASFLRRHRRTMGVLTAGGLLAGLGLGMLQTPTYTATASVALTPVPVYLALSAEELEPPEVSIDTDAQLLGSPRVLGAIASVLGIEPDEAGERLAVSATPHSRVLHVAVSAVSPDRAALAANTAVEELVERRREVLGALQESQLVELRLALSTQERELAQAQGRRLVVPEQDELFAHVLSARASLDELEDALAAPAEVVFPATPPTKTDYRNTEVPATSGAMLGLLLGLLLGLVRDRRGRPGDPASVPSPTRSGTLPDAAPDRLDDRHDH